MLRTPARDAERARRLAAAPFFHGLERAVLLSLARQSHMRALQSGQVLWRCGAEAPELAFVWEGELRAVRRQTAHVLYRSVPINGVIGFSNAIGRVPCSVDVVASTATRVVLV